MQPLLFTGGEGGYKKKSKRQKAKGKNGRGKIKKIKNQKAKGKNGRGKEKELRAKGQGLRVGRKIKRQKAKLEKSKGKGQKAKGKMMERGYLYMGEGQVLKIIDEDFGQ